jgi:glycosyltransferase involved in cell wall biosynthesis
MPIISLLIPIYNGEPYIQSCLNSLRIQDPNDIEILFLDDKSTDNTLSLLKNFVFHSKFEAKVLSSKKNRGFYRSLKILLRISSGTYYHVIGHDDFLSPNYLKHILQSRGIQKNCDIVYCNTISYNLITKSSEHSIFIKSPYFSGEFFLRNFFKLYLGHLYVGALSKSSFGIKTYLKLEKLGCKKFMEITRNGFLNDHRVLTYFFSHNRKGTIYIENQVSFFKGFKPFDRNINQHDGKNLDPIDYSLAYLCGIMSTLKFDTASIVIWMHCYYNLIRSCAKLFAGKPCLSTFLRSINSLAIGLNYFIPEKR